MQPTFKLANASKITLGDFASWGLGVLKSQHQGAKAQRRQKENHFHALGSAIGA
jgi:hypothetical protein